MAILSNYIVVFVLLLWCFLPFVRVVFRIIFPVIFMQWCSWLPYVLSLNSYGVCFFFSLFLSLNIIHVNVLYLILVFLMKFSSLSPFCPKFVLPHSLFFVLLYIKFHLLLCFIFNFCFPLILFLLYLIPVLSFYSLSVLGFHFPFVTSVIAGLYEYPSIFPS